MCIRPEFGFCCVQYQVCAGETNAFSLSSLNGAGTETAMQDDECISGDYVAIPASGIE